MSAKVDISAIPTDLSSFTNSPGYLSAVPDSYKTYQATKVSLSSDGYVVQNDLEEYYTKSQTSSSSQVSAALQSKVDISAFSALSGIANPKASVISLQETLISVLTVLKGLT